MEKRIERPAGPQLELLIWDFNGTMVDDLPVAYGSVEFIFRLYDRPIPSKDVFRNGIGSRFMDFYYAHGIPKWATAEHLNVIREDYYLSRLHQVRFRPGLKQLLEWSKKRGIRHAVCSAELATILNPLIDRDGLRELFEPEGIVAQAWSGKTKELRELCEKLGVRGEAAAYVDDTADGVRAAEEAGVRSIGFAHPTAWNSAQRIEAAKPVHVVHDFRQLQTLLEALAP